MFGRENDKKGKPDAKGDCSGGECDCSGAGPGAEGVADVAATEAQALKQQLEDLNNRYLRTVADYQNAARRSLKDSEESRFQGMKSVVASVMPVLDHFDLALGQDAKKVSVEQLVNGVKVIRDELMRVLQGHGVEVIVPAPNAVFDPNLHQAVKHEEAPDIAAGRVVATLQSGYKLDGRVVRPAMVSVRPAADGGA